MASATLLPLTGWQTANTSLSANPTLYRDTQLAPTIRRPRPFKPFEYTNNRTGGCDADCVQECTLYHVPKMCEPLLKQDPDSRLGSYVDCYYENLTKCMNNACGCRYGFAAQASDCDPSCQSSTSDMVQNACMRNDQEFPSLAAFQACQRRMQEQGDDGCGCVSNERLQGYPLT